MLEGARGVVFYMDGGDKLAFVAPESKPLPLVKKDLKGCYPKLECR